MSFANYIFYNVGHSLLRHGYALLMLLSLIALQVQAETPLRIAVSSNFAPVVKQLLPEFTQQTGKKAQVISGVTGGLYQQLKHGAPYDIFLSADSLRPQKLAQAHLIIPHSRKTYAYGQLAIFSMKNSNITWQDLFMGYKKNNLTNRLAIANPKTAPYGKAAKQCLVKQGLWQQLQKKLIIGNNIGQTFQQVRSQAVPMGIVAYSQLAINKLRGDLLPLSCYQPIKQQLVILKNTLQPKVAQQFSDFLLSTKIQQKIALYGYLSGTKIDG